MTLKNLKEAMYLNNLRLLEKIQELKSTIDTLTGTDISDIKKEIENLQKLVDEAEKLINDNNDFVTKHIQDTIIHVTQADKDLWNSILKNAKDYAKSLFDSVTSFNVIKVEALPTEDIKTLTIYLLPTDPKDKDAYDEYMYIDGQWEHIGSTRVDLSLYALKSELHSHENKTVLDKISDSDGDLLYNGSRIKTNVSQADGNAIEEKSDGLFVQKDEEITDEDIKRAIISTLEALKPKTST